MRILILMTWRMLHITRRQKGVYVKNVCIFTGNSHCSFEHRIRLCFYRSIWWLTLVVSVLRVGKEKFSLYFSNPEPTNRRESFLLQRAVHLPPTKTDTVPNSESKEQVITITVLFDILLDSWWWGDCFYFFHLDCLLLFRFLMSIMQHSLLSIVMMIMFHQHCFQKAVLQPPIFNA